MLSIINLNQGIRGDTLKESRSISAPYTLLGLTKGNTSWEIEKSARKGGKTILTIRGSKRTSACDKREKKRGSIRGNRTDGDSTATLQTILSS